jgi:hypothetical protein
LGTYKRKETQALRAFTFLFTLALESKLSSLVKIKKPHTGRFLSLAEREGTELPSEYVVNQLFENCKL